MIQTSLSTLSNSLITISSCDNIYSNSALLGGFISLQNKYVSILVKSSTLQSFEASQTAGVFYITDGNTITL